MGRRKEDSWLTQLRVSRQYVIRYRDPRTGEIRQQSTGTAIRKEADRKLGEFRQQWRERRDTGSRSIDWEDARKLYEDNHLPSLAEGTSERARTALNSLEKAIHPRKLEDVDAHKIAVWQKRMREQQLSENTIASNLAHLRAFLNWHVEQQTLASCPKIRMPARALRTGPNAKLRGRPLTEAEVERMVEVTVQVVGAAACSSWQFLIRGLERSGLRLGDAMNLYWDQPDKHGIEWAGGRPMFRIVAEHEKARMDRDLPMAPDFAEMLLAIPEEKRTGPVFSPLDRAGRHRVDFDYVSHTLSKIGRFAQVVVSVHSRTQKEKYASAHDLRRTFASRWANRLLPKDLQLLMRHTSIETTLRYYVGQQASTTNDLLWKLHEQDRLTGHEDKRDFLRDTPVRREVNAS
jgi:integrase